MLWAALGVFWLLVGSDVLIDEDVSAFLDTSDPRWDSYESLVQSFGDDSFLAVMIPFDGDEDRQAATQLSDLTRHLEQLGFVSRVESLATYRQPRTDGQGAIVFQPLLDESGFCESCLDRALDDAYVVNAGLLAKDATALGLVLYLERASGAKRHDMVAALNGIASAVSAKAALSGVPVFRAAVLSRMVRELAILGPLAAMCLALVVVALVRSIFAFLCGLCCGVVATLSVLALMGWASIPLSLTTFTLPAILMGLGMAYSLHVAAISGEDHQDVVSDTVVLVVISGVTTSCGFLSMGAVSVPAIRDFGLLGAVGVCVVVLSAVTLVPAMIELYRPAIPLSSRWQGTVLFRSGFWARHSGFVVLAWLAVATGGAIGLSQLRLESDIVRWFPLGEPVRDDYESIRRAISGITPLSFVIEGRGAGAVRTADSARAIARFVEFLREDDAVGGAFAYTDLLQSANVAFGGSEEIPSSREGVAQLVMFLHGKESLDQLISLDGRAAKVLARLDDNGSSAILGLAGKAESWWSFHGDPALEIESTGIMYEYARAQELISDSQVKGLILAIAVIAMILFVTCRDLFLVVAVMISSVVPAIIVYGVFGLLSIPVDAATVCVGAVAIGIAVDDSVHIAARYGGFEAIGVQRQDWERVVPVLVVTTATVCAGFAVLGLSTFAIVSRLGLVTAATLALCLVSDLTLLPALLRIGGRERL